MNAGSSEGMAWGISVGSMYWSARSMSRDGGRAIIKQRAPTAIPASVLLGIGAGESNRLDLWNPPHPRGMGLQWPLESVINSEQGSGRFPLAAAWTGRLYNLAWPWKPDDELKQIESLDAISLCAAKLASITARKELCSIVIPNDFKQREQQKLLDSCESLGVNATLVWLPIAAILAWQDDRGNELPEPSQGSEDRPTVLVIHADWGCVRCSVLTLVIQEDEHGKRWVPARRRPIVSDWEKPGFGWRNAGSCSESNLSSVWQRTFGLGGVSFDYGDTKEKTLLEHVANWNVCQSSPEELDSELAHYLEKFPVSTAAIVVGDFAKQISEGRQVGRILASCRTSIAGGADGENLLARGAAIFARHRLQGRVSYLDTLPNLELFVDRGTHYDWLQLLGDSEHFVSGGQQWDLPIPIEGLAVRKGGASIKLVVAHDEYKGVRELQISLDRPAEVDLGATLHVSATPAQGNARLILTTEAVSGIAARSFRANWERMTQLFDNDQKPLDKLGFEKECPKAFPNVRPRIADSERWKSFSKRANALQCKCNSSKQLPNCSLLVAKVLNAARISGGRSAVSSEGLAPSGESQELVGKIAALLFEYLRNQTIDNWVDRVRNDVIKVLAFISANLDGLERWIIESIGTSGNVEEPICMIAGNCIRTPEAAALFVRRLLTHIPHSNRQRLLNYQMQAIGRLLSQRLDIMRDIPEKYAYQLVEECLKVFEDEIGRNNLAWLFEHSGLVVVYTLRYRMINAEFLDPESELALRAKKQFEIAIEKLSKRLTQTGRRYGQFTVSPGRINLLTSSLQQLIDYIDKRGEGDILLALED